MFTDVYVHYTQKRALYGFDPIRALSALRRQIPYLDSAGFLRELTLLINRLRDQHTQLYVDAADQSLTSYVAALPFLVEPFGPHLSPTYLVTKTSADIDDADLRRRCPRHDLERPAVRASRRPLRRDPHRGTPRRPPRPRPGDAHPTTAAVPATARTSCGSTSATDSTTTTPLTPTGRSGSSGGPSNRPPRSTADDLIEMRTRRAINVTSETARRARKLLFATELWERDQRADVEPPPRRRDGSPRASPTPSPPRRCAPPTARSATCGSGRSTSTAPAMFVDEVAAAAHR